MNCEQRIYFGADAHHTYKKKWTGHLAASKKCVVPEKTLYVKGKNLIRKKERRKR
jgi:hypothetical protein